MMRRYRGCGILSMAVAGFMFAGLLAGCAGTSGDVRPLIAMDGTQMNVQDPVEEGRALLVTGQYGLAVDKLWGVLHDDPRNVRTLTLLAEAYDRLHRYDLADRYHAEALQIDPNSVAALNNWGYSHLARGDKARAVGLLERAAAIKGDNPVVQANLRLAIGDAATASGDAVPGEPSAAAMGNLRISEHVTMMRQRGKLVRVAPGVQLLVTRAPAAGPTRVGPLTPAMPPYVPVRLEPAGNGGTVHLLMAPVTIPGPSPFRFFPEVDDYARQWQVSDGLTTRSVPPAVTAG